MQFTTNSAHKPHFYRPSDQYLTTEPKLLPCSMVICVLNVFDRMENRPILVDPLVDAVVPWWWCGITPEIVLRAQSYPCNLNSPYCHTTADSLSPSYPERVASRSWDSMALLSLYTEPSSFSLLSPSSVYITISSIRGPCVTLLQQALPLLFQIVLPLPSLFYGLFIAFINMVS